jgi:dihydrofolate reductase
MRKVVAAEYVTVYGVITDPGGLGEIEHGGWPNACFNDVLSPLPWNGTLPEGDLAEEVATVKEQPGQDILIYGSGGVVSALHPRGLIDEYRLMVFPVTLGEGKRLFRDGGKADLRLADSWRTDTGVAVLTYAPSP